MDFFKFWRWPQMLASTVAGLALLYGTWLYIDYRLGKHYKAEGRAEQAEEAREARVMQSKASTAAAANFKASQVTANKVLDYRLTEITNYAKKLPNATLGGAVCAADPEFVRLYNAGGRAR